MKSGSFSKRSVAATKGFEPCEFWFQVAFFNLNTVLYVLGKYLLIEENNRKISLALYIRFELNHTITCNHILFYSISFTRVLHWKI